MLRGRCFNCTWFFLVSTVTVLFLLTLFLGFDSITKFIDRVVADSEIIRPNADGTTGGTAVGCTGGLFYECVNETVIQPTAPSTTATDYIQQVNTEQTFLQLGTFTDIDTATSVTVWIYHSDAAANAFKQIALYDNDETTLRAGPATLSSQTSTGWTPVTFNGLTLTQAQVDTLAIKLDCEKTGGGKSNDCFTYAMYAQVSYDPFIEITVGTTTDTQQNLDIGTTSAHVGGAFTILNNAGTRNVTSIEIEENGTVNAATSLDNIKLLYEVSSNCDAEIYNGTESQFGSTDTDGFSAANGVSTFTGSVALTAGQEMCVYPVMDVLSSASPAQTIEIEINNPTTDLAFSDSPDIEPNYSVTLPGTTIIQAQQLDQIHYHWRNDDGDETDNVTTGATSATGGTQDTTLDTLGKTNPIRLRLEVSNEGNKTSTAVQYRLEYAQKVTSCTAATGWTDVGAVGGDWDMNPTGNLTEGNDTTDIANSSGGVTNENSTFLTPNGGVRDTTSQTGNITLTSSEFVELEYSIVSTSNANEGNTYCFRLTNAGTIIDKYTRYPEATILADVNVSTLGSQHATVDIPTSDTDVGATFVITDNIAGDNTVQSITISADGTVDLQNDINNIELRYDLDTTAPYNCASESFDITDTQFGTTDTNGFSTSGTSTFTGSQVINPTQTMCVYVVYDVDSGATNDETLDISIEDASTDVIINTGTVSPTALVDLSGTTVFVLDKTTQTHFHWRNDNGSETGATSATGGAEDTTLENLRQTNPVRLRIGVANEGSSTTPPYQYRLEFALRVTTCGAATGWTDVGASDDEFNMYDSTNITDGNDTTNISVANGGVTDVGTTFFSNNNAVKDTSSQTASLTLPGKNYTDLEFSITASTTATEGATYCFRLTNAGTPLDSYLQYPKVSIKPRTDFYVQRGITTISGTSGTINAGSQYIKPSSSSTAFIRIVGTHNVGAGSPTNTGNADDVTVYISNPWNIENSITFTRPGTAADTTRVNWEIIEYVGAPGGDNEMIVRQQQTATYLTANATVNSPTVSGIVDDTKVAVFVTGQLNPDTATNYPYGLSTAAWNAGSDTVTFTRGATGNTSGLSYSVVEFVGSNWKVQRAENTYTAAGTTETQSITAVGSLSRTFLHAQKRIGTGLNNHSDFGHNVYLSGIGQVSFELEANAATPGSHTSVAWVIENTQTIGDTMVVSRSNGSESSGAAPKTVTNSIGVTISDKQDASLFINNVGNEANGGSTQNSFPEPILGAEIINSTQYQNWVADPGGDSRTWRAEVVEWPTAARDIEQNYYRFYVDNDSLIPSDPWPVGVTDLGENTEITVDDEPLANGSTTRLRMTLHITSASMDAGIDSFTLQYGERSTTCSAIDEIDWHDVGDSSSTTALWRGYNGSPTDGTALSTDPPGVGDLKISVADTAGTYEEDGLSALTPFDVIPGDDVEFDWLIQHNGATDKKTYCFRMIEANGALFDGYNFYPAIRTAGYEPLLSNWRWYDDETSLTPSTALANENISPIDIANQNAIKLRLTVREASGAAGADIKFALQYSEYADFSKGVFTLTGTTSCQGDSLWCYADGAGFDNVQVDSVVISDAGSCTGGSGAGCGTHNEGTSTANATYDQPAFSTAEYEFTLSHAGARANAVYYFRLYDLVNDAPVELDSGSTYPSLTTEGAQLVFTVGGVDAGITVAGQDTDATTTPTAVTFGSLPIHQSVEAAQQLTVDTNATEGYQLFMLASQQLTNNFGDEIPAITSSNSVPAGWSTACLSSAKGCAGYHTTDATLFGGSGRFAPIDSYAALSTSMEEVMYSSIPATDVNEILYRVEITENQEIGDYQTDITYIVIPTF